MTPCSLLHWGEWRITDVHWHRITTLLAPRLVCLAKLCLNLLLWTYPPGLPASLCTVSLCTSLKQKVMHHLDPTMAWLIFPTGFFSHGHWTSAPVSILNLTLWSLMVGSAYHGSEPASLNMILLDLTLLTSHAWHCSFPCPRDCLHLSHVWRSDGAFDFAAVCLGCLLLFLFFIDTAPISVLFPLWGLFVVFFTTSDCRAIFASSPVQYISVFTWLASELRWRFLACWNLLNLLFHFSLNTGLEKFNNSERVAVWSRNYRMFDLCALVHVSSR